MERLLFKEDPVDEIAFPRLRVKHKALVPEDGRRRAVDLADRGDDVAPEEWQRMLAERNTSNVRVCVRVRVGRRPLRRRRAPEARHVRRVRAGDVRGC